MAQPPPFFCCKTDFGRHYCYDIGHTEQCAMCAHVEAGGKVDAMTGTLIPLSPTRDEPHWLCEPGIEPDPK